MIRRSGLAIAFAAVPFLSGLLLLAGCDSSESKAVAITPEERDAKVKSSMDHMRDQYASKKKR